MGMERYIKFIKEGEPVSPGTPNRPLQQIDQNVNYLLDLINAAQLGSTVYARSQSVDSTLQVGQPVWLNPATAQFEAAYAATDTDSATGYLTVAEQAQVWGIVAEKHNATLADILLFGYAEIDMHVATDTAPADDVSAGTWYLSGASAGKLTRQQPPVSVPVCKTDLSGNVFVNPSFVDFLENHRHYVFELEMEPAGTVTPPSPGGTHSITAADSSQTGWLPASDAVFNGNAPVGAKFGYNLSQNPTLSAIYPPIPLQSAAIQMQRPSIYDHLNERKSYGEQLMDDLVVIDRNGIWWLSDCYDEVPWPTDLDTTSSISESYSECDPQGKSYSMRFYYARVNFATDNTAVASLNSKDSRLVITCEGTDKPATNGPLDIDLDLSFMVGGLAESGYSVFKSFDSTTNTFDKGPVASGVFATSNNVLLTGSESQVVGSNVVYRGDIGIGVLASAAELHSQLVRLDGVIEANYPVLYLGFPNDNASSYVVKFEVPADAPVGSTFSFRPRIIGRTAGTLPPLSTSYYTAGRPTDGLNTPITVTQSYTSIPMTTVATLVSANQAVEATSDSFAVTAGDIVYIKLERDPTAASDSYAGELGIMQQIGILSSPS
jgi:hypothetical protein